MQGSNAIMYMPKSTKRSSFFCVDEPAGNVSAYMEAQYNRNICNRKESI